LKSLFKAVRFEEVTFSLEEFVLEFDPVKTKSVQKAF
jgi:hypothetical protein